MRVQEGISSLSTDMDDQKKMCSGHNLSKAADYVYSKHLQRGLARGMCRQSEQFRVTELLNCCSRLSKSGKRRYQGPSPEVF